MRGVSRANGTERTYDERGRVVASVDHNLGRINLGVPTIPVYRSFSYDALDRVTAETIDVQGIDFETTSTWTANNTGWQRQLTYPSGKTVTRQLDQSGRLDFLDIGTRRVDFDWTGGVYIGHDHDWSGDSSVDPMRRRVTLDGLGRGTRLETTMVDRTSPTSPLNPAWADEYCEGSYDASVCGEPLFDQTITRDVLGRARSIRTMWGNPEAGPLAARPPPWRGFTYDAEGRLTTVFEQEGLIDPVVPTLPDHSITNDDVLAFVASHDNSSPEPILPVDWVREDEVGAVLEIVERPTNEARWLHDGAREAGHQLGTIELDNATFDIEHDEVGRVTEGAGAEFTYGPRGRLMQADRGNGFVESYLYDAEGRLAQVINGKTRTIVHDGNDLIAAMNLDDGTRWEVVRGAYTDQILEYESFELADAGRYIAVTDHRNSVVAWFNADHRQLRNIVEYTPHGRIRVLAPDGTELCVEEGTGTDCHRWAYLPRFGFAGAYRSLETGVTYMRNRWYAPKLGQFLTHDPLGYIDSYNMYAYASMDPINFWDPYGLDSSFIEEGAGNPEEDNCADGECLGATTRGLPTTGGAGKAQELARQRSLFDPLKSPRTITQLNSRDLTAKRGDLQLVASFKLPPSCKGAAAWCSLDLLIASPTGMARTGATLGGRALGWLAKTRPGKFLARQGSKTKQLALQVFPWMRRGHQILTADAKSTFAMSADEIADVLREAGYGVEGIQKSTKGSGKAVLIRIAEGSGPEGAGKISQVQVHPGGGRHQGRYVKISTGEGTVKIIDDAYQSAGEKGIEYFKVE